MKAITIPALVALLCVAGWAEAGQDRRLERVRGRQVAVIDADRREWQGRLIEVAHDTLTLEMDAASRQFPIDQVRRVDADGDGVLDGMLKGALFGGVVGALVAPDSNRGRMMLQAAAVYGLIGTGVDALNHCRHPVYHAPAARARVTVSW